MLILIHKSLNSVLVNLRISQYKNQKDFCWVYQPNWTEEVFVIKQVKEIPWVYVTEDHKDEEITQNVLWTRVADDNKIIKEKVNRLDVQWKGYNDTFNSCNDKSDILWDMSQYFPKPYSHFIGNVKVELDLSNYATNLM